MDPYSEMVLGMLAVDLGFVAAARIDAFIADRAAQLAAGNTLAPIEGELERAGLLDAGQIEALAALRQQLEQSDPDITLGRLIVAQRLLPVAKIQQALRRQKSLPQQVPLGDLLVQEKLIDPARLAMVQMVAKTLANRAAPAAAPAAAPPPAVASDPDAAAPARLGAKSYDELLLALLAVDQGFVDLEQVRGVLSRPNRGSIQDVLVSAALATQPQLDALARLVEKLEATDEDVVFGRLAITSGAVRLDALEAAMLEQRAGDELVPLADLLVSADALAPERCEALLEQVDQFLGSQTTPLSLDDVILGTLVIDQGVMTQEQLDHSKATRNPEEPLWVHWLGTGLVTQDRLDKLNRLKSRLETSDEDVVFAQIATDSGLVTVAKIEEMFRAQKSREVHLPLGDLLLQSGSLTVKQKREVEGEVKQRLEGKAESLPTTGDPSSGSTTAIPASAGAAATPAAAEDSKPKGKRFGPYLILGEISRGGMGVIYKAQNTEKNRVVALKTLAPHLAINQEFVDRFHREAQALSKLNHPHIVAVHTIGHAGKVHFMEMEFVDGETVRSLCDREGALSVPKTVSLIKPIVSALDHAWGRGIIHRDVKPENILLNKAGVPKLADFGIAKLLESDSHTRTGDFFGSPYYVAPEQLKHAKSIDFRADIYALGACMFRMLTGEPPFGGDSAFQIIARVLHDAIPAREDLPVPMGLVTYRLLESMMSKEPPERPRSGAELIEQLDSLVAETPCARCQSPVAAYQDVCPECGHAPRPPSAARGPAGARKGVVARAAGAKRSGAGAAAAARRRRRR